MRGGSLVVILQEKLLWQEAWTAYWDFLPAGRKKFKYCLTLKKSSSTLHDIYCQTNNIKMGPSKDTLHKKEIDERTERRTIKNSVILIRAVV